MTYRDDREADQARIVALEHELDLANRRITEIEDDRLENEPIPPEPISSAADPSPADSAATPTSRMRRVTESVRHGWFTSTYVLDHELSIELCREVLRALRDDDEADAEDHRRSFIRVLDGNRLRWSYGSRSIEIALSPDTTTMTMKTALGARRLPQVFVLGVLGLAAILSVPGAFTVVAVSLGFVLLTSTIFVLNNDNDRIETSRRMLDGIARRLERNSIPPRDVAPQSSAKIRPISTATDWTEAPTPVELDE